MAIHGPPENWITAISLSKWAVNEHNRALWDNDIRAGDVALFHSMRNSDISDRPASSVIGFGYIGSDMAIQYEPWWVQEVRDKMTLNCPSGFGFTAFTNFTSAQVIINIHYTPFGLWWRRKTETFPLKAMKTQDGGWIWESIPRWPCAPTILTPIRE